MTLRPSAPRPAAESDGRGSGAGVVPAGKARDGAGTPAPSSGAAADSPAGKDLTTTAAPEAKTEGRAPVVDPFPAAVAQAIDKAKKWLLSQQQPDGSWRGPVEERRGPDQEDPGTVAAVTTGLTLYALLRAGANPEDRAVERGLAWLSAIPIGSGTREMRALRLLALVAREEARRPADPGERVEVPAEAIQGIRSLVTLGAGEWASSAGGAAQDLPVMDWSALSLVAAARLGVVVPDSTWTEILEIALARQEWKGLSSPRVLGAEGGTDRTRGFVYPLGESRVPRAADVTALRTAAGLSTVLAARYVLGAEGIQRSKTTLRPSTVQTAMFDAAAWLDVAWPGVALAQAVQSGRRSTYRYVEPATLAWAVHLEHAMAFVGVDRLGAHVWHREIGDALLQWQRDDGGWAIDTYIDQDSRTTSSALLFLVRASRPTVAAPSIAGPEKPLRAR